MIQDSRVPMKKNLDMFDLGFMKYYLGTTIEQQIIKKHYFSKKIYYRDSQKVQN